MLPITMSAKQMLPNIVSICKNRNKQYNIIIRGNHCENEVIENENEFKEIFNNGKHNFGFEYCFVDMLIRYPNVDKCLWNVCE